MIIRRLSTQHILALLTALAAILAGVMAFTNPLGEAPDEPAHMAYVRFLVSTQRLPVQCASPCVSDVPGEGHQPPLAYIAAALVSWPWMNDRTWQTPAANPDFIWNGGNSPQAYIHGTQEQWPWQGIALGWRMARLLSVVWMTIAIWVVGRIALHIKTPQIAVLAVSLLAISPQTAFIGSTVSNDALLFCLASLALWATFRATTRAGVWGLTSLICVAMLTKQNAVVLWPLVVWVLWYRIPHTQWWSTILGCSSITLLLLGWWYLRNVQLYGDPLGYALFQQTYRSDTVNYTTITTWLTLWRQLIRSGWGTFGWMSISLPAWWYQITASITIIAMIGAVAHLRRPPIITPTRLAIGSLIIISLLWLIALTHSVGSVAWQSRLTIMAWPALAIAAATGLTWAFPRITHSHLLTTVIIATLVNMTLWFGNVLPAIPLQMPSLASSSTPLAQADGSSFTLHEKPGYVTLVDYSHNEYATQGGLITIYTRWVVTTPPNHELFVSVRWRNTQDLLFNDVFFPMHPQIPSHLFRRGDRFMGVYTIEVPDGFPTGKYTLLLSLFDPDNKKRAVLHHVDHHIIGDSIELPVIISTTP
jgi:Dolichyl-phosphate-mannose-protein mannosyltransferase